MKKSIEDKIFTLKFYVDEENSHLKIKDSKICLRKCKEKFCLYFCPAGVYKLEDEKILVNYQACLECGSCRKGCPFGNIEWSYPKSGYGVCYKFG